ncbi:MAG: hypothetical protein O7G84_01320 [Gammaproteobacteria bacterium]|nr:hypothetical protein [Gammaproteobacteria bacterium]
MTAALRKLIYLCYELDGRTKEQTRRVLLDDCAPELSAGTARLQMNIDDPLADVRSPAPSLLREAPVRAQVNLWIEDPETRWPLEDVLRRAGFQIAGYLVDEHVYTDYGGNRHAEPRDWPDGERSPGVLAVTLMERPKRLSKEEWISRWHGRQSPMSEAMQPRSRYVRNVIERALTPAAAPFEGIVEEAWPSMRHVTNPFLFYGANSPWELARNMATMLRSVTSFLDLGRIRTVTMSEYFLQSGSDKSVGDLG